MSQSDLDTDSTAKSLQFRLMQPGEETEVRNLIVRVFNEFIAPHYSEQGVQEFLKYVHPQALLQRTEAGHFILLAIKWETIIGVSELRHFRHISLLFVEKRYQQHGIGKMLLQQTLAICRQRHPEMVTLTVNSSPNAVEIYKKLGFKRRYHEQVKNGLRFTPMVLSLRHVEPSIFK